MKNVYDDQIKCRGFQKICLKNESFVEYLFIAFREKRDFVFAKTKLYFREIQFSEHALGHLEFVKSG